MQVHHLRNATLTLKLGEHCLLVDPMLSAPGSLPGFKLFGGGKRNNPLVPLPQIANEVLDEVTAVVITHEHPDHLDPAGIDWIKEEGLPVWASSTDAPNLRSKGLDVHELADGAMGMGVELVAAKHGPPMLAWAMGPVWSIYLAHPDEPSVFLTSDSVLSKQVIEAIDRLQPDVVVAPAGAANFGAGPDILFSVDELVTLVNHAPKDVIMNHLEALDHCPTTRADLQTRMDAEGLGARVHIPADGELLTFERKGTAAHVMAGAGSSPKPGFQKWLTAKFTGT